MLSPFFLDATRSQHIPSEDAWKDLSYLTGENLTGLFEKKSGDTQSWNQMALSGHKTGHQIVVHEVFSRPMKGLRRLADSSSTLHGMIPPTLIQTRWQKYRWCTFHRLCQIRARCPCNSLLAREAFVSSFPFPEKSLFYPKVSVTIELLNLARSPRTCDCCATQSSLRTLWSAVVKSRNFSARSV